MTKQFTAEQNRQWRADRSKKLVDVKVVIWSSNGNVLLVKPDYKPTWQFPGGGVEAGESPIEAALREIYEETGLRVDGAHLKVIDMVFKPADDHLFLIFEMQVKLDEATPLQPIDPEVETYQFVASDEVAELLPDYYSTFWQKYE